jgi:Sulfotransferase family
MTGSRQRSASEPALAGPRDAAGMEGAASDAPESIAAGATPPRFPDFFIVGHPKSGTAALVHMLLRHPRIFIPVKEPRFFSPDLRSRFRRPISRRRADRLEGYLSIFADAGPMQRIGDASTAYLKSCVAASRIAEVQPSARIIAVLREPTSFLRSWHLQLIHNYVETQKDFQKAIELEDARRQGKRIPRFSQLPQALLYSDHVRYVEHLRRYHEVFPQEQVLVLIYDDFRDNNEETVRSVLRFLQLEDDLQIEPLVTKPLPNVRLLHLHQLARLVLVVRRDLGLGRPRSSSRAANANAFTRPRGDAFRAAWRRAVYSDPVQPNERFMLELRRRFKPEVVALSEYLDRDLVTLWGYDRID